MQFKQKNDGSCDITFSWKERLIIFFKGKVYLSSEGLRHFGNTLVRIVSEWNDKFDSNTKSKFTYKDSDINLK